MNPTDALLLVREKYTEEQKGLTSGPMASRYKTACEKYPAMMKTAHHLWALQLSKSALPR